MTARLAATAWVVVTLGAAAAVGLAAGGAGGRLGLLVLVLVVLGAMGLHLVLVPLHWLPAAALVVQVLVPVPVVGPLANPLVPTFGVLLLLVYAARSTYERREEVWRHGLPRGSALPIAVAVLLVLGTVASIAPGGSFRWAYAFILAVLVIAVVPFDRRARDLLVRAWVLTGLVLSVHVLGEVVTQSGFFYGRLYDAFGVPPVQHWSTYRPEASFRHPLPAGLFLATSAALAAGEAVRTARVRPALVAGLASVAAAATLSRSALLGLVVGLVVVLLMWTHGRFPTTARWRYPVALAGLAACYVAVTRSPLADRFDTVEATRSAEARTDILPIVESAFRQRPWTGTGPGTSEVAAAPHNPLDLPIESSVLQLLVSLGVVGLLLVAAFCGATLLRGVRRADLAAVAGLATFLVGAALFNLVESRESMLVFLGMLVAANRTMEPEPAPDPDIDSDPDSEPATRAAPGPALRR